MASIWQITLSGYDAQAASESGQSATGKIALGTWGSYGHETIQVTLAEPWDVCTLVTATFLADLSSRPLGHAWHSRGAGYGRPADRAAGSDEPANADGPSCV